MAEPVVQGPVGVLAILVAIASFFFFVEKRTGWRMFQILPPLLFIYLTPVILSNLPHPVIPKESAVYDNLKTFTLPMLLVMLLLKVDVAAAFRVMGQGVFVMLAGTAGVVLGAPLAYLLVSHWLAPDAWRAFVILSGSWVGGTGNMAAATELLGESKEGTNFGLAVLGDTTIYIVWLPILLLSKRLQGWFGRFTRVSDERLKKMEKAAAELQEEKRPATFQELLWILCLALLVTWLADLLSEQLVHWFSGIAHIVAASTWRMLIVTTLGIALSFSPCKRLAGSQELAMAFLYVFVAMMGASANLAGIAEQAIPFLCGAMVWICIHGLFCLLAARLFRVDVHTAAIASAANIGGAASAPIVAAYHRESLVPVSILMALIGYAVGNYAAFLTMLLCRWVSAW